MAVAILDSYLPNVLIDDICELVHKLNFRGVLKEVKEYPSILEAATKDSATNVTGLLENLTRRTIKHAISFGMGVIVVGTDHFFVYQFKDDENLDLLVEGYVETNDLIKIERFYASSGDTDYYSIHGVIVDWPFALLSNALQYVLVNMYGPHEEDKPGMDRQFTVCDSYESGKKWLHPSETLRSLWIANIAWLKRSVVVRL